MCVPRRVVYTQVFLGARAPRLQLEPANVGDKIGVGVVYKRADPEPPAPQQVGGWHQRARLLLSVLHSQLLRKQVVFTRNGEVVASLQALPSSGLGSGLHPHIGLFSGEVVRVLQRDAAHASLVAPATQSPSAMVLGGGTRPTCA